MRLLAVVPIVGVLSLGTSAPNAARKCGTLQASGKPLYSIDGIVTGAESSSMANLGSDAIYSVDIICMNPKDSTFNRSSGVAIISVWTKKGPAPRIAEALDVVRAAQDAHFAKYGRYISAVAEIPLPESMKGVQVTIEGDLKGWVARSTVPKLLRSCVMFDGAVTEPIGSERRKSVCARDY